MVAWTLLYSSRTATFRKFNPRYKFPVPVPLKDLPAHNPDPPVGQPPPVAPTPAPPVGLWVESHKDDYTQAEMTDEELLLTPAVVYGFSLPDKLWCTCPSPPVPLTPKPSVLPSRSGIQRRENQRSRLEHGRIRQPRPPVFQEKLPAGACRGTP